MFARIPSVVFLNKWYQSISGSAVIVSIPKALLSVQRRSRVDIGVTLVCLSDRVVNFRTTLVLFTGTELGGANYFGNLSTSLSNWICFH